MSVNGTTGSIFNKDNYLPSVTAGFVGLSLDGPQDVQPQNVNYLYQTNFRFDIFRLPKFEYFIQSISLPGFGATDVLEQPTRFVAAKHPNTKLSFQNLDVTFLVDEDLSNWREIYDWMRTIYLMDSHNKFEEKIGTHFSDGTLHTLNSAMLPNKEIRFRNLIPVSLSGFQFESSATDLTPITATITFAYDYYEFL